MFYRKRNGEIGAAVRERRGILPLRHTHGFLGHQTVDAPEERPLSVVLELHQPQVAVHPQEERKRRKGLIENLLVLPGKVLHGAEIKEAERCPCFGSIGEGLPAPLNPGKGGSRTAAGGVQEGLIVHSRHLAAAPVDGGKSFFFHHINEARIAAEGVKAADGVHVNALIGHVGARRQAGFLGLCLREARRSCLLLARRRIGQKAHSQHGAGKHRRQNAPKRRTLPPGQIADASLGIPRAEGQGHGQPSAGGQGQDRRGIVRPDLRAQLFHHSLVAGHLHVPPREEVGKPHQGIEPVEAQRPVGQKPRHMVAPVNVQPLVEEDIVPLPWLQIRGQVDPWPQKSQHKGRGDLLGQVDPLSQRHRAAQPQEQPEVCRCRPGGQDQRAGQPDPGGNLPDIRLGLFCLGRSRLHRVSGIFRRCGHIRGIDRGQVGDGAHGLPRLHRRRLRP